MKIADIRKSLLALSPEPTEPRFRKSGLLARDARISSGDTKDFVDFVRSTGPTTEPQVVPLVLSSNGSLTGRRSPGPRLALQAREADVRSGSNNDLVDFIRQGPPNASSGMSHPEQYGTKYLQISD
jgi:hypothetical protein